MVKQQVALQVWAVLPVCTQYRPRWRLSLKACPRHLHSHSHRIITNTEGCYFPQLWLSVTLSSATCLCSLPVFLASVLTPCFALTDSSFWLVGFPPAIFFLHSDGLYPLLCTPPLAGWTQQKTYCTYPIVTVHVLAVF